MKIHTIDLWRILPGALAFSADQMIKYGVRRLPLYEPVFSIPGVLDIMYCTNTGAAFSMMSGKTQLLAALSVIIMAVLLVFLFRQMQITSSAAIALSILCGGGLGNFADRLLFDGVTDYIRLRFIRFPVFNLADICITLSVLVLMIELISGRMDRPHGA